MLVQMEKYLAKPDKQIVFLWGARQTGKSTILKYLFDELGGVYLNFGNQNDLDGFEPSLEQLKLLINMKSTNKKSRFIFIDEVQYKPESTLTIKLLADSTEYVVVATGSSELRAKTQSFDTLAGRYKEFVLFPLTIDELACFGDDKLELVSKLTKLEKNYWSAKVDELMVYGGYPRVALVDNKIEELKSIATNSVLKDIVNIYDLKDEALAFKLLQLLATQIGNLINENELASNLGANRTTIRNYLQIFCKNRIIYLLAPWKNSPRRSYLLREKIYFYDLGIRNSLIEDFRPINLRPDAGAVWENLMVMGKWRSINYKRSNEKLYYYRELIGKQNEVDLIIDDLKGIKKGYEIKMKAGKINKIEGIGVNEYKIVDRERGMDWLI